MRFRTRLAVAILAFTLISPAIGWPKGVVRDPDGGSLTAAAPTSPSDTTGEAPATPQAGFTSSVSAVTATGQAPAIDYFANWLLSLALGI